MLWSCVNSLAQRGLQERDQTAPSNNNRRPKLKNHFRGNYAIFLIALVVFKILCVSQSFQDFKEQYQSEIMPSNNEFKYKAFRGIDDLSRGLGIGNFERIQPITSHKEQSLTNKQ